MLGWIVGALGVGALAFFLARSLVPKVQVPASSVAIHATAPSEIPFTVPPDKPTLLLQAPESEHPKPPEGPRLAIVMDDMGLKSTALTRALPLPITLSFLTYAPHVGTQAAQARAAGHEVLAHVPMEPFGTMDPGPGALRVTQPSAEVTRRLAEALAPFGPQLAGFNNHMGSRFTADSDSVHRLALAVRARGVFFLDSRTSRASQAAEAVRAFGGRAATNDFFLDGGSEVTVQSVLHNLDRAARLAQMRGSAIVIGHPFPATLTALESWCPDAKAHRGLRFVPVEELAIGDSEGQKQVLSP